MILKTGCPYESRCERLRRRSLDVEHGAGVGAGDVEEVAGEPAVFDFGLELGQGVEAGLDFGVVDFEGEFALGGVDGDGVAGLDRGDGAAGGG